MSSGSKDKTTGTSKTSSALPKGVESALGTTLKDATSLYGGSAGGFNSAAYLAANPDVAAQSKMTAQQHYDKFGRKEGRSLGDTSNVPQLFKPYTDSTVVQYSPETQQSWDAITKASAAGQPGLTGAFQGISGIANGSGFNGTQDSALAQLQAVADAANGSYAESNLKKYADGSLIGASNPAFERVLARTQNDAQGAVERSASAAGRYGSGIAQGNVAREVGDVTASALSNQMNQDIGYQFAANGQLDGQRMANLGLRQSAAGDIFNAGQQGQQNRFTASGMLPSLFDATLDPSRALAGIGAQKEDLATREMNDKLRIFQEQQAQPRQSIEWLSQIAQGNAGATGGTTTTASKPSVNPFLAGIGGAASGYGSTGSLTGGLLGGAAGALGSIF